MAACMSRHSLMLFAGAILALTFVHGLEAAEPSPDKQPCDKQDNDEPGTLCRATINCYCISGTYLDIPPNLCDTFDQDNIECSSYCKPCPDGKFSPFDNRCLACRPVTPCKPNEEVIINATGRADQVCGCRRQDLTCPPCPEQTTPTFTSTQVETVVDTSVNPPPCPQKEQATDPQGTFGDWSCVIGFLVPICLVLSLIGILYVFLKKRGYRLRLPWEKVAKQSDPENGVVKSDVPSSNDGEDSVDGGVESGAPPSNGGDDSAEKQRLLDADHQKPLVNSSLFDQLKNYLPVFGMDIRIDVPGEGNCFFHAVKDQLERLGCSPAPSAADLRKDLVEFLGQLDGNHPIAKSLASATKTGSKDHLIKLAKDGTYVEAQDVAGTAEMLKRDLIVVKSTADGFMVVINKGNTGTKSGCLLLGLFDEHYISLKSYKDRRAAPLAEDEEYDSQGSNHEQPAGVGVKPIDQNRAQQLDPSSSVQPNPSKKAQAQQSLPPDSPSVKPKPGNNNRTQQSSPSSSTRPNLDSPARLQSQQSDTSSPIESPNPELYKPVQSYPAFESGSIKQLDSSQPIRPEIINSKEGM